MRKIMGITEGVKERYFRAMGWISEPYALKNNQTALKEVADALGDGMALLRVIAHLTSERDAAVAECEFLMRNAPLRGVGQEDGSRWKARAEALENAVRKNDDFGGCTVCVNYKYCFGTGKYIVNKEDHCPDDRHWEFDETRFSEGADSTQCD